MSELLIGLGFRQSFDFGELLLPSGNHQLGGRLGSSVLGCSRSVWSDQVTKTSMAVIWQREVRVVERRETEGEECSSSIPKAFYHGPSSHSRKQLSFLLEFNLQLPLA